jgi:hypothetical protein
MLKMNTNKPTIENLINIKEKLENMIDESSDSTYTPSSRSRSSSRSKIRSKQKDYKTKYNSLESKIRYMQLEMTNRDIEITELSEKINSNAKYDTIMIKINSLFERLDNMYTVLTERINTIDDKHYIKLNTLIILDTSEKSCTKGMEKYAIYLVNDIHPLLNNQVYFKNAIDSLYDIKMKELKTLITKINNLSLVVKFKNTLWITLFSMIFILCINISVFAIYYIVKYRYIM